MPRTNSPSRRATCRAFYEQHLRALLEPEHTGEYLVLDIETGEYEIDTEGSVASLRAYHKNPDGVRYGLRIGYPTWGRIGLHGVKGECEITPSRRIGDRGDVPGQHETAP